MSTDDVKLLQEQLKNLENQFKVFENHVYIVQNDIQYNQKALQLEQAKQQSQITGLASLILDYVKESRQYEEQREANVVQRLNNFVSIDLNDFGSLGPTLTSQNPLGNDTSLINGITLNSSSTQQSTQPSASMLPSSRGPDQMLTPSSLQAQTHHLQQQAQLQQYQQPNSLAALQQSFLLQQQQQRTQNRLHQQQHSQKPQKQAQKQVQQQRVPESRGSTQQRKKRKQSQIQQLQQQLPTNTDPSSILDGHLSSFSNAASQSLNKAVQGSIAPSESVRQHIPIRMNGSISNDNEPKPRKVYDKGYNFIKAPNAVEEIWNEYSVGLDGQPSVKSLELEFKTGWRKDPATSKKFNRRKAIYHAIEKGLGKGYNLEYCIQLLEEFRWIDRDKNLKQPIGWLCHGNLPHELK